jgi:hypothetical protein
MKRRPRIYYSDSQKALMWERWKQGWTLQEIDKLFDRAHSSIHRILAETGGIRHAQRSRAATALTLSEREEISRAIVAGASIRPSLHDWDEHHRQSAGRSSAMVGTTATGPTRQMQLPGTERGAQVLQTRCESRIGPNRGPQVTGAVVAAADCWLAQADLSLRREPPRVTRNHLPQSVHSSAWRLEEGTVATPQTYSGVPTRYMACAPVKLRPRVAFGSAMRIGRKFARKKQTILKLPGRNGWKAHAGTQLRHIWRKNGIEPFTSFLRKPCVYLL